MIYVPTMRSIFAGGFSLPVWSASYQPSTPASFPGLAFWFRAEDLLSASFSEGEAIGTGSKSWIDYIDNTVSASAKNVVTASGQYFTTGSQFITGLPAVHFKGNSTNTGLKISKTYQLPTSSAWALTMVFRGNGVDSVVAGNYLVNRQFRRWNSTSGNDIFAWDGDSGAGTDGTTNNTASTVITWNYLSASHQLDLYDQKYRAGGGANNFQTTAANTCSINSIGYYSAAGQYTTGSMAEVCLWTSSFSLRDIWQLMQEYYEPRRLVTGPKVEGNNRYHRMYYDTFETYTSGSNLSGLHDGVWGSGSLGFTYITSPRTTKVNSFIDVSGSVDTTALLSNSTIWRRIKVGTYWSRIRIAIHFSGNGTGSLSGFPTFCVGLSADNSSSFLSSKTTNFIGAAVSGSEWKNTGSYYPVTLQAVKKVGTITQVGGEPMNMFWHTTGSVRQLMFVDIDRDYAVSATDTYRVYLFTKLQTGSLDVPKSQFDTQVLIYDTQNLTNYPNWSNANGLKMTEDSGSLDYVCIGWDRSDSTINISNLDVYVRDI